MIREEKDKFYVHSLFFNNSLGIKGEYIGYMLINIVATVPCFLLCMVGMESLFKKKSEEKGGNDSNFDGGEDKNGIC